MKTKKARVIILVGLSVLIGTMIYSFKESKSLRNIEIKYKNSVVSYYGSNQFSKQDLLVNAKLIDIADRRFETKWVNKDPKGISEEYTTVGAVFMKPGKKPRLGRADIEKEFKESVKGVDRVAFFQDELEFFGDMDVAFQRCHMLGYVNTQKEHIFEGSYIILWKKENGKWLIEYDMFNSDK
ncbi:Ketosteroid isomerase homolog [Tenacibaculum sp. MAR_2009_124]|uniref:YybH family protein n=1 Tax=Tenacibaculum sp. MAR_2009_124 TaxID=1250059 RepID=UPI00089495EB|nr:nuclear transport factor 2 family protein [Tenacibaculum sp. MAR_2009_124]SEB49615.1 Ketosteroid isomerase homolog [Tenacibaculum sp. MAR_2009_124]